MEIPDLLADWRAWAVALGLVAAYAEARWKLQAVYTWMQRDTDPDRVTRRAQTEEKLASAVDHLAAAITKLDTRVETLTGKYEKNTERVWRAIDESGQRLSKIEGKLGGGK